MTIKQLEEKYGIRIVDDSFWNPLKAKFTKAYRIYSADGCPWTNGLRTIAKVEEECKQHEADLLAIKLKVDKINEKYPMENDEKLMKYIPKYYKPLVEYIHKGERKWNERTKRWNTAVVVKYIDENTEREYETLSYMKGLLQEFGRDC